METHDLIDGMSVRESERRFLSLNGYFLGDWIGSGSFSNVFRAQYSSPPSTLFLNGRKEVVVCKVMEKDAMGRKYRRRFLPTHLQVLQSLHHDSLLSVHSLLESHFHYFFFLELATSTLLHFIHQFGPVQELKAKEWFKQLIQGVEYVHSRNIAHRNITCGNILISMSGSLRLSAFHFAVFLSSSLDRKEVVGTAEYMAPEMTMRLSYDPTKIDIWACGVVLYYMANLNYPFVRANNPHLFLKILQDEGSKAVIFSPMVLEYFSIGYCILTRKCLEFQPKKRPTALQVGQDPWLMKTTTTKSKESSLDGDGIAFSWDTDLKANSHFWEEKERKIDARINESLARRHETLNERKENFYRFLTTVKKHVAIKHRQTK